MKSKKYGHTYRIFGGKKYKFYSSVLARQYNFRKLENIKRLLKKKGYKVRTIEIGDYKYIYRR